jgi:hypothetical protein
MAGRWTEMPKGIYERKPKGAAAKAVVPIHDLIPASGARKAPPRVRLNGQAPITVQFGKIKITIEVDG